MTPARNKPSTTRRLLACVLLLAGVGLATVGCHDRKIEQIQRGLENVDQHAAQIEQETDSP